MAEPERSATTHVAHVRESSHDKGLADRDTQLERGFPAARAAIQPNPQPTCQEAAVAAGTSTAQAIVVRAELLRERIEGRVGVRNEQCSDGDALREHDIEREGNIRARLRREP